MKIAIVHYWLLSMRGGEKVIEALCELFPQADLFTHVYDPDGMSDAIKAHNVRTTFIQKLPAAKKLYKKYLPLMPMALEELDLRDYDLVISSEAGPAKGVITRPDSLHVCYCHSPMRYIWDHYHIYRENAGMMTRLFMSTFSPSLRAWDVTTAARVDHFIANSGFVAKRIRKFYRREATVIHPPVAVERFSVANRPGEFYLCAGQLVRYKRIDLAVEAFSRTGRRLLVAGTGEEAASLKKRAAPNVEFLGRQSDTELQALMENCRALIFPGEEEFGIVPVEVMACGRPIIAYGAGGILETAVEGKTAVFFREQTVDALNAAVDQFEDRESRFNPRDIRARADLFTTSVFKQRFSAFIERAADGPIAIDPPLQPYREVDDRQLMPIK